MDLEALKYPIGKYGNPEVISREELNEWIEDIIALPEKLEQAVSEFTDAELDTPYRPDGWTVRQVVHHVADSHMNAYIRFSLALTEDNPAIRPYKEDLWAELPYQKNLSPEVSLNLLFYLHKRWVLLLKSMSEEDFDRTYFHPESHRVFTLRQATGLYAWHSRHHLAHITRLVDREFRNE